MCALNKTKKGNKAFSYLFWQTLSNHHICHGVRPFGCHVKFFLLSMNFMSMNSITEVFYHLNKMLIATKHNADNNFCLSARQRTVTSCMQHSPNLSASLFLTYDSNSTDVLGEPTDCKI